MICGCRNEGSRIAVCALYGRLKMLHVVQILLKDQGVQFPKWGSTKGQQHVLNKLSSTKGWKYPKLAFKGV